MDSNQQLASSKINDQLMKSRLITQFLSAQGGADIYLVARQRANPQKIT